MGSGGLKGSQPVGRAEPRSQNSWPDLKTVGQPELVAEPGWGRETAERSAHKSEAGAEWSGAVSRPQPGGATTEADNCFEIWTTVLRSGRSEDNWLRSQAIPTSWPGSEVQFWRKHFQKMCKHFQKYFVNIFKKCDFSTLESF